MVYEILAKSDKPMEAKLEYLSAIQSVLVPVGVQVGEGLKRYGLEFEVGRTEKFGLGLEIITASRYRTWQEFGEWKGKVVEGNSWPILLVLGEGISREAVGSLKIDEYERFAGEQVPGGLNIERTNDRGTKNTLLSASVEARSGEEWHLRRNDRNGFYAVSVNPRLLGDRNEVRVLALLYQRKGDGLQIIPFSVETTGQLLWRLKTINLFTSLNEVKARIEVETKPATVKANRLVDLSEVWLPEGYEFFEAVREILKAGPDEWVRDGVVGEKYNVSWVDAQGQPAVTGKAHKAGYFDKEKVVTTHIAVEIEQVSGSALTERRLKLADSKDETVRVKIFLLTDGTIKMGVGESMREIKEVGEKKFWKAVLMQMRISSISRNRR
ncbi:MAG: hypothetical protein V1810_03640 [Candidatus Beckwithbacteria bacterium]